MLMIMCASIDKYLGPEAHVNVTLITCLHFPGAGIALNVSSIIIIPTF